MVHGGSLQEAGEHVRTILNLEQPLIKDKQTNFEQTVQSHQQALRRFALSIRVPIDRVDDLVQDTTVRAITKERLFKRGTNLQAWLFTMLRNLNVNHVRAEARRPNASMDETAFDLIPDERTAAPDAGLVVRDLKRSLARLSPEQREAIRLVAIEGMTYEGAADHVNVPVGTIRSRLSRGRGSLREMMQR